MTDVQLRMTRAGTRVRSRETARLGTVLRRWSWEPLVENFTHINVQMDDGTPFELDTKGSILATLDFIAGGYINECENCGAQSLFLTYRSVDIDTAQAQYTCGMCGHEGTCKTLV